MSSWNKNLPHPVLRTLFDAPSLSTDGSTKYDFTTVWVPGTSKMAQKTNFLRKEERLVRKLRYDRLQLTSENAELFAKHAREKLKRSGIEIRSLDVVPEPKLFNNKTYYTMRLFTYEN